MTKQLRVGGYTFNLTTGHRYLAGRPFATGNPHEKYTVTVTDITYGFSFNSTPVECVPGLSYAAANRLLDAFNAGESSFKGRLIA